MAAVVPESIPSLLTPATTAPLTTDPLLPCGCPPRPIGHKGLLFHRPVCEVFKAASSRLTTRRAELAATFKVDRKAAYKEFVNSAQLPGRTPPPRPGADLRCVNCGYEWRNVRGPMPRWCPRGGFGARKHPWATKQPAAAPRPTLTCARCAHEWVQRRKKAPRACPQCHNDWRTTAEQAHRRSTRRRRRAMRAVWEGKTKEERDAIVAKRVLRRAHHGEGKRDPLEGAVDDDGRPLDAGSRRAVAAAVVGSGATVRAFAAGQPPAPSAPAPPPNLCALGKCSHPSCRRIRGEIR